MTIANGKPKPKIFTDQQDKSLAEIETAAKALADNTAVMKTQEGRALLGLILRLVETLNHGEPQTAMPSRHHP